MVNTIPKTIKPLFTTEDGVIIFEGDTYYYTDKHFNGIYQQTASKDINCDRKNIKKFSTRDDATIYILMNCQKYSIDEILALDWIDKDKIINKLIKMVKDK